MARPSTLDPVAAATGFHALSDGTRLEILGLLRNGERCVCELMDAMDAAQSRLSFHLRVLKEAGLVTDRREGRWVYYTLHTETLTVLEATMAELRTPTREFTATCKTSPNCCS